MAFYKNFAYEASAGSGKTFALVVRYISLLFMDAKPESILALTFTNKAANEMKSRVTTVLKELHLTNRTSELNEISKILELDTDMILKKQQQTLSNYLQSNIKIMTIDKFLSIILRKFSLHLGIMPDFLVKESRDEEKFLQKFISLVILHNKYKELIKFSVYEDKKLKNIFSLLDTLYEKKGELNNIKIENLDNKTLNMQINKLALKLKQMLLNENLSTSGKNALDFNSIDELIQKSWLQKKSLKEYKFFKKFSTPMMEELFFELKSLIKLYFISKENYYKKKLFDLFSLYQKAKKDENINSNILGFNDVTNYTYELLREKIDNEFLYFRLDSKIDHLLIDEFQDTSIIQYKILEPIIDEISAGIGTKEFKTFFYVGDVKQSIYRFRGGAKELFYYVKDRYHVKIQSLSTNYRSKYNLVSFVNQCFKNVIPKYIEQNSNDSKKEGFVKVCIDDELLEIVSKNVFELLNFGIDKNDIAILCYTNDDALKIETSLLEKDPNLKITKEATFKLLDDKSVSAIIELLKFLYFKEELYRVNFLTKIGLNWNTKIDFSIFNINKPLIQLVKHIINHFKLFDNNENLLQFIEVLTNYNDIESFLFEYKYLDINTQSYKSEGIKILTIHKSKGLEFDHVIVVDRFSKKNSDSSTIIFDYKNIELQNLYLRFKARENFDQNYQNALEKQKILSQEDELNVQYVAFTRAKESLIICQKENNSSFKTLNLKPITIGQIKPKQNNKPTLKYKTTYNYKPIILGLQENTLQAESEKEQDIKSINFGLAMHYMLEIIKEFDKNYIEEAYWSMKNRFEILLEKNQTKEIKKRVLKLLTHSKFLELIDGKILKEQPIAFEGELKIIDLLIEKDDHMIIIDYKSSLLQKDIHLKQINHYKYAIEQITQKPTKAFLFYLQQEKIEYVEI